MLDSSWNLMVHGDSREGKWRGNWRMEWVASTLHTTSEHGVSSITTADAHTSAASSRLNWRPRRFKWIRPFHRKTKYGFCACAITFQLAFTMTYCVNGIDYDLSYKTVQISSLVLQSGFNTNLWPIYPNYVMAMYTVNLKIALRRQW